jgi:hypothetical protein
MLTEPMMHASSSGFFVILIPIAIAPDHRSIFYRVYALVLSAAAVIVIARYGRNLKWQP